MLVVYIILSAIVCLQQYNQGYTADFGTGKLYTKYNNHVIFCNSFNHLLEGTNLYQHYPSEQHDLYKYSPTFSLLYGSIAWMPMWLSLLIWILLNSCSIIWAVNKLELALWQKNLLLLFVIPELLISIQNTQSNALMSALIIASYGYLRKQNYAVSTLLIVFSAFIKLYSGIGFLIFLWFPNKIKYLAYCLLWTLVLALLPIIAVTPSELVGQYDNWVELLASDRDRLAGLSVLGVVEKIFPNGDYTMLITAIGFALLIPIFALPKPKNSSEEIVRLGQLLIWMVVFNHMAESPTYIVAMLGVGLILLKSHWPGYIKITAGILAFVLTSLTPGDLFPKVWREDFFKPYLIKSWCSILILFASVFFWGGGYSKKKLS